jgi:hypothetical protein
MASGLRAEPLRNGFDLAGAEIPLEEILPGGPPRDGIPALDHPPHAAASGASWADEQPVLGVAWKGQARAYPIAILTWHELVNDTVGGRPVLISYCPLCGSGIVFERRVAGTELDFGVSGLLYRSDLLMYDRQTESLWSQIGARAVSGEQRGQRLSLVRSAMMPWRDWRAAHPGTTVLTRETGHRRDYDRLPYGDYASSSRLAFPAPRDDRYHPKELTVGLRGPEGESRAYPAFEVLQAGGSVEESFAGQPVRVAFDRESRSFRVEAPAGVEVVESYWFAWAAFHPGTTVFTPSPVRRAGAAGEGDVPGDEQGGTFP